MTLTVHEHQSGETRQATRTRRIFCEYPDNIPEFQLSEGWQESYVDPPSSSRVQIRRIGPACPDDCYCEFPCVRPQCHPIVGCICLFQAGACQPHDKCYLGECKSRRRGTTNSRAGWCNETVHIDCSDENACTRDICDYAVGCMNEIDDTLTPPQQSPNDCKRQICRNGSVTTINDPTEERVPAGDYPHDCFLGTTCQCDDTETPLEDIPPDPHDCIKYICRNCNPTGVPSDSEEPIEESPDPHDCVKLVCLDGNPTDMPDKTETPLSTDEICCEGLLYEKYPTSEPGKQIICIGQGWGERIELVPISNGSP